MFTVMVKNTGIWGCTVPCKKEDGSIEQYQTKDEAQKRANDYNNKQGVVNRFNYYFVEEQ